MYLKPDEVDIKEPPTIVSNIKNKDKSKFDVYIDIPEVEIDEMIDRRTLEKPWFGIIKK